MANPSFTRETRGAQGALLSTMHAYSTEDAAKRARRDRINAGERVSLIAGHPSGYYVFDVYTDN